jgi:hypothetical protein
LFPPQKFYILGQLKPHAKFQNPTMGPSRKKVTEGEEERREKKRQNSGHLVL